MSYCAIDNTTHELYPLDGIIDVAEASRLYWGAPVSTSTQVPAGSTGWTVSGKNLAVPKKGLYLVIVKAYANISATKGRLGVRLAESGDRTVVGYAGHQQLKGGATFGFEALMQLSAGNKKIQFYNETDVAWSVSTDQTVNSVEAILLREIE